MSTKICTSICVVCFCLCMICHCLCTVCLCGRVASLQCRDTLYLRRFLSLQFSSNIWLCLCLCVSLFLSLCVLVFVFVFVCLCGWLALAAVPCVRVTLTCYAIKRTQRTAHRILLQSIHRSELLPQLLPTDFSWFSVNPTCYSVSNTA